MDDLIRIKYAREAGQVKRCHTVPVLGYYDVAQHSYNMLSMLRVLYPNASTALIWAIHAHDIPERSTGDIPSTAKWAGVVERDKLESYEEEVLKKTRFTPPEITPREQRVLKGLDMLELYFWALDQRELGNKNASVMQRRILEWVSDNTDSLPEPMHWLFNQSPENWGLLEEIGYL